MVAIIKHRLTTDNIFTTVVVSLLTVIYRFSWIQLHYFISAIKIRYWRISVFYRAPFLCLCYSNCLA